VHPVSTSAVPIRRQATRLPQFLAVLYGLMIVYASLEPFSGWTAPPPGTPFFLFQPWPAHVPRFDIVLNVLAYAPFGFLLALAGTRQPPALRLALAIGGGTLLSLAMESLQMLLPTRDASNVDVLTNGVGATLGGLVAASLGRMPRLRARTAQWRDRTFVSGPSGDLGLALLGIWILAQVNPGIPLFAATFDPPLELTRDLAGTLLQAAQSAFSVIGVGLFLGLLLRRRRHLGAAVLLLIGLALAVKAGAAQMLLKSASRAFWLEPGISLGVAAGTLALMVAIWLPRPVCVALCAIALVSSLVAPLLASDLWRASAPLARFDWPYGQLLNFNRLTHAVLVVWPLLASAYLLWLAGQPGWGGLASQEETGDRV